jgi:hypothetical protein
VGKLLDMLLSEDFRLRTSMFCGCSAFAEVGPWLRGLKFGVESLSPDQAADVTGFKEWLIMHLDGDPSQDWVGNIRVKFGDDEHATEKLFEQFDLFRKDLADRGLRAIFDEFNAYMKRLYNWWHPSLGPHNAMAFFVCYSWSPPDDHTRHPAVYLDQQFYELIYGRCRPEGGPYSVLREIALLRYKSPRFIVSGERLALLDRDLERISESGASHPQIAVLRQVCAKAMADGCALTVSGDMYPELWRKEAEPDAAPDHGGM